MKASKKPSTGARDRGLNDLKAKKNPKGGVLNAPQFGRNLFVETSNSKQLDSSSPNLFIKAGG
jgi:hypothetical protein